MSNPKRIHLFSIAAIAAGLVALSACGPDADPNAIPTASAPSPTVEPSNTPVENQSGGTTSNQGGTGSNQGGSNNGGGQSTGQPQSSWPSPEDCVSYNPGALSVKYENGVYTVYEGTKVVAKATGQQGSSTGQEALALAKRYSRHCYIGRTNQRTDERNSYVFDYWRDASGSNPSIGDEEELCSSYNRNNLTVEDMGSGYGWRVKDHDHVLHLFDNERDARNGKIVLAKYGRICSIGDNDDNGEVLTFSL